MASSPLFWVLALALLGATLALLVVPLLRRAATREAPADESAAAAVFRDHKRQIEADYAARAIGDAERDAALGELTRRFGQELAQAAPASTHIGERSRWIAALVLVACVPVAAGVLYFTLGNPAAMTSAHSRADTVTDTQIQTMVDELAKRLQRNPEDGEGWAMLGRSYRVLGRLDASVLAYGEAAKRLPNDAGVYVDWAEAAAQLQGRSLAGQPTELLERALKLDPANVKALALLGAAAMERNDRATAKALWTRLRATLSPDSPQLAQVDAALARIAESPSSPPVAGSTTIEGRVEIDPKLAASLAPSDTVFIFARDPDGPRMPLAAMKVAGADLPRTFALTDEMAMSPALTISKAGKVIIEARVSKSGDVKAQPGDLAGTSAPVTPGARNVRVTIDRVLP